ncbi:MAG: protein adenylyltransferase SelO [Methyloligellaceae bacterium]
MTTDQNRISFNFDNSYAGSLEDFYVSWKGDKAPAPKMIKLNTVLAEELRLDPSLLDSETGAEIFSGSKAPEGANPLAQAYAGHQFGFFSSQLGDGRALLLGEVIDIHGNRKDIHLKGSGATPFSRGGDGKAALGPVLREYLLGEAMHALGIPTTRALAAVTTGQDVIRETILPGAVFTRVAASHIRVGTFQFFAARRETEKSRQLADYTIARHYPHLKDAENPYLSFFEAVLDKQAALIARWMHVGFVHGVMNTDNMTISGETIDYGPCAFIDNYNPDALFSSIDEHGRYAYKNQPVIAKWNLSRFAESLLPLIDDNDEAAVEKAKNVIATFPEIYTAYWLDGMRTRLGLSTQEDGDLELANDLLSSMENQNVDYTLLFRSLAKAVNGKPEEAVSLFDDPSAFKSWLPRWQLRYEKEDSSTPNPFNRAKAMNKVNPLYIPRNHKVEEALTAAVSNGDYSKFETLLEVLEHPYDEIPGREEFVSPPPDDLGPYKTFCGT